jgi:hypothetical protein
VAAERAAPQFGLMLANVFPQLIRLAIHAIQQENPHGKN